MAYGKQEWVDQPGKGSLFINKQKKSNTQPDYKGKILVNTEWLTIQADGTAYLNLSVWTKATKDGGHLLSLSQDRPFTPNPEARGGFKQSSNPGALLNTRKDREIKMDDSDVPF